RESPSRCHGRGEDATILPMGIKPSPRSSSPDPMPAAAGPRAPGSVTGRQASATAATDEKRERIVEVAARLFFEHGYANTTIAGIARELGVTKPYVYYYFGDKRELFEAICWPPTVECLTAMHFDDDDPRPAHEKLAA